MHTSHSLLKAVIVEDQLTASYVLSEMLENTQRVEILANCQNPDEAMNTILKLKPDVVFLTIEMSAISGLEIAKRLAESKMHTNIVFVTTSSEYAVDAFDIGAVGYLLKPIDSEKLLKTLLRIDRKAEKADSNVAPTAYIYCLGGFEVFTDAAGENLVSWRTSKAEELFAYMFCNRKNTISKWKIYEAVFSDIPDDKADTYLHTTIYQIRSALKKAGIPLKISFKNNSYLISGWKSIYIDVDEFLNYVSAHLTVDKHNISKYEKILMLYKGEFLSGKNYGWAASTEQLCSNSFSAISLLIADYYEKQSNYDFVIRILNNAIERRPLSERLNERLLKTYLFKKDKAAFIKHYQYFVNRFYMEYGVMPNENVLLLMKEMI